MDYSEKSSNSGRAGGRSGRVMPSTANARIIADLYAGEVSELSSVLQYVYWVIVFAEGYPDISKGLEKISIDEMKHLEQLGGLLIMLGADPRYATGTMRQPRYWTADQRHIKYITDPRDALVAAIELERKLIGGYNRAAGMIKDFEVKRLLQEFIEDEHGHIDTLTALFSEYTAGKYARHQQNHQHYESDNDDRGFNSDQQYEPQWQDDDDDGRGFDNAPQPGPQWQETGHSTRGFDWETESSIPAANMTDDMEMYAGAANFASWDGDRILPDDRQPNDYEGGEPYILSLPEGMDDTNREDYELEQGGGFLDDPNEKDDGVYAFPGRIEREERFDNPGGRMAASVAAMPDTSNLKLTPKRTGQAQTTNSPQNNTRTSEWVRVR